MRLTIPPALGYGDKGAGNFIPPGATTVFEVETVNIEDRDEVGSDEAGFS
jgi:FK506-binding protein 14